ncbi:MAG: hypothetical protein EA397_04210 [Deltaproteobacteria bacterium]|nr:MAG: hypothetical protein EA397_04210 [Deltaproteobacteria bacterium]
MIAAQVWQAVAEALGAGQRVFIALVADHTRHSPGTRGATLALLPEGPPVGTIGGGGMEHRVLERGKQALASAGPFVEIETLHHRKKAKGKTSGLLCAGWQTNLYAVLEPDRHAQVVRRAASRIVADEDGVLFVGLDGRVQVLDASSHPDEAPVRVVEGGVEIQLLRQDRAVIFGGGHCGLALSRQLAWLDFFVSVAEVRDTLFTLEQNDAVHDVITGADFADLAARVRHPALTHAIVMTSDMPSDVRALLGVLQQPFLFVGLMGAPAKIARIRHELTQAGYSPAILDRIVAPVGLPISSSRPSEIAVSVAAQILQLRPTLFPGRAPSPLAEVSS